jgi:hypothetical protein
MDFLTSITALWPVDWVILGALAALLALDTIRSGVARTTAFALALPVSLLLFQEVGRAIALSSFIEQLKTPLLESAFFFAIIILVYFLIRRALPGGYGLGSGKPLQALFAGIAGAGVIMVVWLSLPFLEGVWVFGPQVQALFAEKLRFWWIIGSYAVLAFARG